MVPSPPCISQPGCLAKDALARDLERPHVELIATPTQREVRKGNTDDRRKLEAVTREACVQACVQSYVLICGADM